MKTETQPQTFEQWMARVNRIMERHIGVSADDLEDWCWHDSYDAGDSPKDAVLYALDEMGLSEDDYE